MPMLLQTLIWVLLRFKDIINEPPKRTGETRQGVTCAASLHQGQNLEREEMRKEAFWLFRFSLAHWLLLSLYYTQWIHKPTHTFHCINSINMIAAMTEKWCHIESDIYMYIPVLDEVKDTDGFKES